MFSAIVPSKRMVSWVTIPIWERRLSNVSARKSTPSIVIVPELDLVLPHNAAGLDDGALDIAAQASAAWEAAVCWDDDYAVERLAEVRAV